jgi:hypothetical protein
MLTPTQIARATISDPRASRYLAMTHRTLAARRERGELSEAGALRLLRNNARDGRRALGQRCGANDTLDKAARLLYMHWRDSSETE